MNESIVEMVPVRAMAVGFGHGIARMSNRSGCARARQAGQAMKHGMELTLSVGAPDLAVSL